ncbi:MAG TPA: polysaccharide deacetylase family protein [Burkholderiales bacterium]|nr:polysaccharide deacetylase family protein [Burkholderiales bacterium]
MAVYLMQDASAVNRHRKNLLLGCIKCLHICLLRKQLPGRIALYFHELDDPVVAGFEDLFQWLRWQRYEFCSPLEYTQGGHGKKVLISFDDNYISWYERLPWLAKHGAKCAFYTNTSPLRDRAGRGEQEAYFDRVGYHGRRIPLSSGELREIAEAGHTVACHTHSHRKLSRLSLEDGRSEMLDSKKILEDIVGKPVEDFAYPYGMPRYFPNALRAEAPAMGFKRIAEGMPCMLFAKPDPTSIQRHRWRLNVGLDDNLREAEIDGRLFVRLFARSPIG